MWIYIYNYIYIRIIPGAVTVTTTGQHYPCGSCSVPSLFGCFIQPLQSGLDGMKAATILGFFALCFFYFFLLSYYCVFDEKKQMNHNCNFRIINQSFLFQQFSLPAYSKSKFCKQLPIAVEN